MAMRKPLRARGHMKGRGGAQIRPPLLPASGIARESRRGRNHGELMEQHVQQEHSGREAQDANDVPNPKQ
jgi:hypothetical protein